MQKVFGLLYKRSNETLLLFGSYKLATNQSTKQINSHRLHVSESDVRF